MAAQVRIGFRIFVLLLLIITLLLAGALWFDFLGIVDVKERISPVLGVFGLNVARPVDQSAGSALLQQERLQKQAEALDIREQELDARDAAIAEKEAEVEQKLALLEEMQTEQEEREKLFNERVNQYDNKRANLRQQALDLLGMPPENAVAILENMDDQIVIDLFRMTDEIAQEQGTGSLVPYWKSLMDPARVAVLNRKMLARQ